MLKGLISMIFAGLFFAQAPVVEKLASGTYTVYALTPQVWRVKVDPKTMDNVTISGHFAVTQGTPKTIEVLVLNEENYRKWKDDDLAVRSTAKAASPVVRKSEGDISAKLTDAGYHYLVISDRFEYEGKKTVAADIKFQYDKR